jgi:hypothetical protein
MTESTLLLRQIHPSFVQAGFPTSQAFRPTPKDESRLSVYDGDLIAVADAFIHFTNHLNLKSVGIMGLTVKQCVDCGVSAHSDPTPFPEHAVIDFSGLNDTRCRTISKRLQGLARERGWLHQSPATN